MKVTLVSMTDSNILIVTMNFNGWNFVHTYISTKWDEKSSDCDDTVMWDGFSHFLYLTDVSIER